VVGDSLVLLFEVVVYFDWMCELGFCEWFIEVECDSWIFIVGMFDVVNFVWKFVVSV